MLRTFTRDLFVQVTLALFLATFTYSLTVLRSVRSSAESASPLVPRLAVTTSFLLALASVIALVLFLAHLTRQIRVETMLRNVHVDATRTVRSLLAPRDTSSDGQPPVPTTPPGAAPVFAPDSGFLTSIEENSLLRAAVNADLVVAVAALPGEFVVAGTPIGATWRAGGRPAPSSAVQQLQEHVDSVIHTGIERTAEQDVAYPLRQLVDVVNKALSPGINDPTTAIHALGHIAALLCELAAHRLGPVVLADEKQTARVVLARPTLAQLLDLAMTQPRRYGATDPDVAGRLYQLLTEVSWHVDGENRRAVSEQLGRLEATTAEQDFDDEVRHDLAQRAVRARDALMRAQAPSRLLSPVTPRRRGSGRRKGELTAGGCRSPRGVEAQPVLDHRHSGEVLSERQSVQRHGER